MTDIQWFRLGKLTGMVRLVAPILELAAAEAHRIGLKVDARNLSHAATACRLMLGRLDPSDPELAEQRDELLRQQLIIGEMNMDRLAADELRRELAGDLPPEEVP